MDDVLALFNAVGAGDASAVERMLRRRPGLARARNADTLPVLQFARYMGQGRILHLLISAGPALDLFEAAQIDRADRAAELLDAQPDLVSAYSSDGFTALHFAAYYGAMECVPLLMDRGANIEAVTKNFLANMPIHAAAAGRSRTREICEILLRRGANVNAKQHGGFVALHTPAQHVTARSWSFSSPTAPTRTPRTTKGRRRRTSPRRRGTSSWPRCCVPAPPRRPASVRPGAKADRRPQPGISRARRGRCCPRPAWRVMRRRSTAPGSVSPRPAA